ncbi:hypothetical protein KP806_13860 [Paenibacillus sp. N4]|uniref:hypothetical protein n=1 Tax=Paenibacillus vietnamensis TaxID=2590547 RepID=UPI001CD103B1|nr:hypothetical protein [Paenibacillus vietnamensis]MCA0756137.1 hypothetical protein [Paenibacillus vietnamensis]
MRKEWKQFWMQPQYWVMFLAAEMLFIAVTFRLLESWQDISGMIFFIMAFNLMFLMYGAEQARLEARNHTAELLSSLPYGARYYGLKFLYWVSHSGLWYLVFLASLLVLLRFHHHTELSKSLVTIIFLYTFSNWFVPFLLSLIIGYSLFTLWPSIVTYVVLAALWIVLSPYNHFVQILPAKLLPWLAISDTNFEFTRYLFATEHMIVNSGAVWQRIMSVLAAALIYILAIRVIRKIKVMKVLAVLLVVSIGAIPFLFPNQEISDISRAMELEADPYEPGKYVIESYKMDIRHAGEDHDFSYRADVSLKTEADQFSIALWNVIQIDSLRWNGKQVAYERSGNWVNITLPQEESGEGILHLETRSSAYSDMNPSSFELLPTLPWYPMHPDEAMNPMGSAAREHYEIKLSSAGSDRLITNLDPSFAGTLSGEAYGPMLLNAIYEKHDSIVHLIHYSDETADQSLQSVTSVINRLNKELNADVKIPEQVYVVSSASAFSANPEQIFITPIKVSLEDKIRKYLFNNNR